MPDPSNPSPDLEWYQTQWEELMDVLPTSEPEEVVAAIEELRERVQTLEERQKVLADAGFDHPRHAMQALTSMKQQLDELYGEKEATERSIPDTDVDVGGDTFDQLQALLAREEKLQRELGVASPDAVIEIVEGLTDQLEDLYQDRDADASTDSIFAPTPDAPSQDNKLEEELGTSDPDAVLEMVEGLTDQLDVLYEGRERLAELNLNGAEEAIEMVRSMRQQLDTLYQQQDQMSEHGISGIDHALSMIENMEAQLGALYEDRDRLAENGAEIPGEVVSRLGALEEKLDALIEEKEALRDERDRLQSQFNELEEQIGTGEPDTVTDIIDDLEDQLETVSENAAAADQDTSLPVDEPIVSEETLAQLGDLDDDALDTLPAGVFCVDDQGTIRRTNENVLQWPSVDTTDANDLIEKNFFDDVAPATKNALFQGRFDDGVTEGAMDERFFYTYVGWDASTNLRIHLYRDPDDTRNWIMFCVL